MYMKTLVRGNQVMVQTNISKEDFNKYKDYGVFTVVDADGNQVYKVDRGYYSDISTFGISCDTVYQGKLAASALFDGTAEEITNTIKPSLLALKENETIIARQLDELKDRLAGIDETIIIEE